MKRFFLSFSDKIHAAKDFQSVYKEGTRFVTGYFVWFYKTDKTKTPRTRLGITVTRAIGNAVVRNWLKRRVREFFRLNKERFPAGDLVLKARTKASSVDNTKLQRDLQTGLQRLAEGGR